MKRIAIALALFVAPLAMTAAPALAQDVIVIDQARVLATSAAGKDIQTKLQGIGDQVDRELQPEATALENEQNSLDTQTQNLTREAIEARPDLVSRIQSFQRRVVDFETKRQKRARELAATRNQALQKFEEALRPVIAEVIREANASVVLDRSQVIFAGETADKTQSVITKLDARTKTIQVSKVNLPDPPARANQ